MKKALVVASIINFINFERNDIKILKELGYEVHCAANLEDEGEKTKNIDVVRHHIDFSRSPFSKSNIVAYRQMKSLIKEGEFSLVHCHTPIAAMITRIAARTNRKSGLKVIYTAHGFHFFKGAPKKNWIIFYPIEWFCSWFTDAIVTINKDDFNISKKRFHARENVYIPGVGLDTEKLISWKVDIPQKRKSIGLCENDFAVVSVGELNINKNHETIIRAIATLKNPRIKYVICGDGERMEYLQKLAVEQGIEDQLIMLGYRLDVIEVCKACDVYAFPSMREGLGLGALEGMCAGLPVVASSIRGIRDYLVDGETGFGCAATDYEGFAQNIRKLYENPQLREKIGNYNKEFVRRFDIKETEHIMRELYEKI